MATVTSSTGAPSRLLVMGLVVTAHAVASKVVHEIAGSLFKKMTQTVMVWSFTVFIFVTTVDGTRGDGQKTFIWMCVSYVAATIVAFVKSDREDRAASGGDLPIFMRDMTAEAKMKVELEAKRFPGKAYIPLIGYEQELITVKKRLLSENNCSLVFVGLAGVGKTCLVDRIVSDQAHGRADELFGKRRFVHISANSIRAGTMFRGSEEQRIAEMLASARKDPTIIFVVDEIDLLTTGEGHEGLNIARTLYEAMGRNEITLWGTTNPERHLRYIEKTPFKRRLPKIDIKEPTPEQCIEMLKVRYGDEARAHTNFKVAPQAIQTAVVLAKSLPGAYPDKAVDIIDQAIAEARLVHLGSTAQVVVGNSEVFKAIFEKLGQYGVQLNPGLMRQKIQEILAQAPRL